MKAGKLNQFLHQPTGLIGHSEAGFHKDGVPRPALGTINVIFTKPGNDVGASSRVVFMVRGLDVEARDKAPKRARVMATPILGFFEEDKEGTFQPHNDALMVTLRIDGYDIKRVLVD